MRPQTAGPVSEPWPLRAADSLTLWGTAVAGVLCALMAVLVVADVVARNGINQPIPGNLDMVSYWGMPGLAFLALGYTQLRGGQIRVELLTEHAGPGVRRGLDITSEIVAVVLVGWLLVLTVQATLVGLEEGETAQSSWVPIWPGRILAAAGLALFFVGAAARLYRLTSRRDVAAANEGGVA